jgi:hypothetical protein
VPDAPLTPEDRGDLAVFAVLLGVLLFILAEFVRST